ncbi:MAG TPA: hypothetical protein VHM88_27030, partial [Candidatus Acidoferrales bacterium]|nr:hypothetical protein [Candidatus Acidoferrales bacterium]
MKYVHPPTKLIGMIKNGVLFPLSLRYVAETRWSLYVMDANMVMKKSTTYGVVAELVVHEG